MANGKTISAIITLHVTVLNLFFKVREAKANKIIICGPPPPPPTPPPPVVGSTFAEELGQGSKSSRTQQLTRPCEELTRGGGGDVGARSGLPQIDVYVRYYYLFSLCANWYFLLKNLVVCAIKNEAFAHWRYLDCLILGRYIVNGRVTEAAPYIACYNSSIRLFWRYVMMNQATEFKLPCLEFLLEDKRGYEAFWVRSADRGQAHCSTLLEYPSPFHGARQAKCAYKLRPNRTRAAWDALARVTQIYFSGFSSTVLGLTILFTAMVVPVGITKTGFGLNYRQCFQWMATSASHHSILNNRSSYYSYFSRDFKFAPIDGVVVRRDFFVPYDHLVTFNLFHSMRWLLEFIETFIILLELGLMLNSACFMTVVMSKDVLLYSDSINDRLERVVVALRSGQSSAAAAGAIDRITVLRNSYYDKLFLQRNRSIVWREKLAKYKADRALIDDEILDLQAQITDLFLQVDQYNRYISLQAICQLLWWLSYSALVSSWIFLPSHDSPQLEWYLIHLGATCYLLIMLKSASGVKSSCHRLYGLMASAMALDENYETSKRIWLSLMRFYAPLPLCSFTLIKHVEITSMSGLKMLAWLGGVILIASSFFQVYNIK